MAAKVGNILHQRDLVALNRELARLRYERQMLLRIAGAAGYLLEELDGDSYYSFESAELLLQCLNQAPADLMAEAYSLPEWRGEPPARLIFGGK